ncbi:MAG: sigma-70 family RNA polymerase sigma factor [Acidimicrobiia bacterium]|nr:sigma-70 family RNA polymerase sigma factor [Acidimicrobiia bacterium]
MKRTRQTAAAVDERGRLTADMLGQYLNEIGQHDLLTADDEVALAQAIEAGIEARARLDSDEKLSRAEKVKLERAGRAGDRAKDRFIEANLRLVVSNARRYQKSGLDMLDLIQEGNLGLIRAVEKFDWRKGFKFSTYATWWIRQAITRAIAQKSRTVRIPVHLHETLLTVRGTAASLEAELGRRPEPEEIAAETGIALDQVLDALEVADSVALETPIGEDGAVLGDFILDEEAIDPLDAAADEEVRRVIRGALDILPERQAKILTERFGLTDGRTKPLSEIAADQGVTSERVRQLINDALARLREHAAHLDEAA